MAQIVVEFLIRFDALSPENIGVFGPSEDTGLFKSYSMSMS